MSFETKVKEPRSLRVTATPKLCSNSINFNTSLISGMLLMVTGSAVNNTAQMTCSASFFAPCGMISPFSLCPPSISNTAISFRICGSFYRGFCCCYFCFYCCCCCCFDQNCWFSAWVFSRSPWCLHSQPIRIHRYSTVPWIRFSNVRRSLHCSNFRCSRLCMNCT